MKNQDLHSSSDEQIRDLLSNMKVGYDESSWSALSHKLDSISSMQETDELFKDSLMNFQANYIPSSWSLLQYKMDYMIHNRRHLIGLKVTEFVLLLLLSWFWWGTNTEKPNLERADLIENIDQKSDPINQQENLSNNIIAISSENQNRHKKASSIPNETLKAQNSAVHSAKRSSKKKSALIPNLSSDSAETKTTGFSTIELTEEPISDISLIHPLSSRKPFQITNLLAGRNIVIQSLNEDNLGFDLTGNLFDVEDKTRNLKVKSQKPFQYWISGAISYDKDLIRTPFPSQLSVNHLGRIERNYHGEINLFVSNGMLEFQTGIGFWSKDYQSVYEGINDAMVISIPANLRLRLSQRGFMRGYLMGGISTHFVAYANYNETSYFKGLENTTIIENNYQARPSTIFSSSGYDHGILEGESVKGNQYFTANMGIGVDIPINSIFSLYMEQVYFHHVSGGIGPAFDKFSTSSTIIGLRYLLNRKTARPGLNF